MNASESPYFGIGREIEAAYEEARAAAVEVFFEGLRGIKTELGGAGWAVREADQRCAAARRDGEFEDWQRAQAEADRLFADYETIAEHASAEDFAAYEAAVRELQDAYQAAIAETERLRANAIAAAEAGALADITGKVSISFN